MPKREYLKGKNAPIAAVFVVWCLAVYMTFQSSPTGFWNELVATFKEFRIKDGIWVVMSPVLALVLTGFISPANKARLVFWKWKHALPGHRAFSRLAVQDPRIDVKALEKKIGLMPTEPDAQNRVWYSLYKQTAERPSVKEAHRQFLLARDLASVSILFALFGAVGMLFFKHTLSWVLCYFMVMGLHYLVMVVVAQNHGRRFVCNVMAEYILDITP